MLRVTEGPFFSEVVAYYEHVRQVVRLYNLPGEAAAEAGQKKGPGCTGFTMLFLLRVLCSYVCSQQTYR